MNGIKLIALFLALETTLSIYYGRHGYGPFRRRSYNLGYFPQAALSRRGRLAPLNKRNGYIPREPTYKKRKSPRAMERLYREKIDELLMSRRGPYYQDYYYNSY